jgi:hypothetical protein
MKLIGLSGRAGCGKTTVARYLIECHGFVRVRFADPLKDMLRAVDLTDRQLDGDLKEQPSDLINHWTPRKLQQWLGTDCFRDQVDKDFWVKAWTRRTQAQFDLGENVVADDVRFPNEAAAIFRFGGVVARISRPNNKLDVGRHESEAHADSLPCDAHIINDGALSDLFRTVDYRLIRGEVAPELKAA